MSASNAARVGFIGHVSRDKSTLSAALAKVGTQGRRFPPGGAGPATSTVLFEDHMQDFLEWDLDDAGVVVACRPFQAWAWVGSRVLNLPEIGKTLRITTIKGDEMIVKYPVAGFGPVKAG